VPRLCEVYPGIYYTTEEKARENLSAQKTLSLHGKTSVISRNIDIPPNVQISVVKRISLVVDGLLHADGRTDGRKERKKDGHTEGRRERRTDTQREGEKEGRIHGVKERKKDGHTEEGRKEGRTHGGKERKKDGHTKGRRERRTDTRREGEAERRTD
jgi:hypothetical protein